MAASRGVVASPVCSSWPDGGRSILATRPTLSGFVRLSAVEAATQQLWICESCGFIYDPDEGDPDGGIPPGTPFEEIPNDWMCPVCGARKKDFSPYDG